MTDLREALENAFDEDNTEVEENEQVENQADESGMEETTEEITVDEEQTDDSDGESDGESEDEQVEETAEAATDENGDQADNTDADVKTEKPPVGWSPKNREHWANLPQELKVQINKREREVNQLLQNTAQERKTAQAFMQTIEPYRGIMASQGVDNPLVAIDELMKTAATLGAGSPQQKAMRIAGLIHHYGVDINTLDSVLAGNQAPQQQGQGQQDQINAAVNQALAPFMQQQQVAAQQQQAAVTQRAAEAVQAIESKEFFQDVRMDMADIMEMASKRGIAMSMEDAYNRAVQMNPEIASVLAARENAANVQNKKRAASSINGNRGGVKTGGKDMSLHDTLAAAWNGDI